jgi:thiol-disulfide isomerase/thioredoxin
VIDQENNLPLYIIQANNIEPKDYLLTSFTNYQVNNNSRPESFWYFSTFTHEYKQEDKMVENLLKPGSVAPDWSLPVYNTNNNLKLSQLKGKMVLLEFWIKNCGYCIAAVPKINALAKKYKGRKFQVIGINAHDTKEEVETFIIRNNPSYQTVYASGKLCSDYGVMAYPSFFLIDKKGLILYSGPLEPETFERFLETQLK